MVNDVLVLVEVEGVLLVEVEGVLGAEEAVPGVLPFQSNTNLQQSTYYFCFANLGYFVSQSSPT